jgi:hypothetical protein
MKPELVKAWTKALLSGEYKQGEGTLKCHLDNKKFEYCCLGVLAEISPEVRFAPSKYDRKHSEVFLGDHHLGEDSFSNEGLDHFGLTMDQQDHLTGMNDGTDGNDGKPFPEIAEWIKENLLK